ncbi:MAG: tryptophan synthase subunit alpha [Oceanicoccus sp.]
MNLENYIKTRRQQKDILLMTHIVLGYPSFDDSLRLVETMVNAGVDLMELQIPFSEPMADGPVIMKASQESLENGATLERCFEAAEKMCSEFDIPFLFMSYCNILHKYGFQPFAEKMKAIGIKGAIVPDIPPEDAHDYVAAMKQQQLDPIFLFAPNSTDARMKTIEKTGSGFIYCVARKGVTGANTDFSEDISDYLKRSRMATELPLAVGFGIKEKADIDAVKGFVDVAIIGTESIRVMDSDGLEGVDRFIRSLT